MRFRSPEAKKRRAEQARARYRENPDKERERKREEYALNGQKTKPTPEQRRRWNEAWEKRYPERKAAHLAVKLALRTGRLVKAEVCEENGCTVKDNLEAHHEDYAKPLEVKWLCLKHHGATRRIKE